MNCSDKSCGGSCECGGENKNRIITDHIHLKSLGNVVYREGVKSDKINKFEVLHFELYFLCPECGYTQKFEKDDASYYAIKFMANYPCISCGNVAGFSGFMVVVSPDKGLDTNEKCLTESEFKAVIDSAKMFNCHGHACVGRA